MRYGKPAISEVIDNLLKQGSQLNYWYCHFTLNTQARLAAPHLMLLPADFMHSATFTRLTLY